MKKRIHKAEVLFATLAAAMLCGCGKNDAGAAEKTDDSIIAATEIEHVDTQSDDAEQNTIIEPENREETENAGTEELSFKEQIEQEIQKNTPEITVSYAETVEYPALAEFLISYFEIPEEYQTESRYYYNYTDLNEDGTKEIIALVVGDYTTGSGGDTILLIEGEEDNFSVTEAFYMVRTPVIISDNITNGWHDLIFPVYGSGIEAGYTICHHSETETYMSESNEFVEDLDESISGHQILSNNLIDDMDKGTYLSLAPTAE